MKKMRLRLFLYLSIFVAITFLLCGSCFTYWKKIYDNKKEKANLEKQYTELLNKEENLESNLVKLQDPEYVAKYAREKYLYSKDGEVIIDVIDDEDMTE